MLSPPLPSDRLARQLTSSAFRSADDAARWVGELPPLSAENILACVAAVNANQVDAAQQHLRAHAITKMIERSGDRHLFVPLVRQLRNCETELRNALVGAIAKVNDPNEHGEVCALLRHGDAGVRNAGAMLIARVGGKTALGLLAEMLREANFPARNIAIEAVVRIGGHRAIPALAAALPVCSQPEKLRIVRVLGDDSFMSGDRTGALAALGEMLCDPDPAVLGGATQAFSRLATEEEWFDHASPALDSAHTGVVLAAIQSLRRYPSRRGVEALHRKLRAGPKTVRVESLSVLESFGSDLVLPAVVEALSHRQLEVRARAGEVLANLSAAGKIEIARTVLWLLRSPDVDARRMAVEVARKAKDPAQEVWPKLFVYLRDVDWWVRERVSDALIEIAGEKLLPYVMGFLSDQDVAIRMFGVEVVRRLAAGNALGALVKTATSDSDWWVRERAVEAIAQIGDPRAAPWLVDLSLREPRMAVCSIHALGLLGAREHAGHVAMSLQSADPAIRLAALRCLETLGDPAHGAAVAVLAKDPDEELATLARRLAVGWKFRIELGASAGPSGTALDRILRLGIEREADDVLLVPGRPPAAKNSSGISFLTAETLDKDEVRALLLPILSATQLAEVGATRDVDFSYSMTDGTRWRVNCFQQHHGLAGVFRVVKAKIPTLEELGLPAAVGNFANLKTGLVLVGGPTGSGKSTTLAAIIDRINTQHGRHIITLEDPIECVHLRKKGLVNQREIGTHATDYHSALKATMREDPDVILVGELRDLQTIAFAITAAETGHLVLGTVHTLSVDTAVDRMVHVFPPEAQDQVRIQLSSSLRGVACQYLLPRDDRPGRVLACEVLLNNDAVAHLIRSGKAFQLPTVIATSRDVGMQSMDGELLSLYKRGIISAETAWVKSRSKKDFDSLIGEESTGDAPTSETARSARTIGSAGGGGLGVGLGRGGKG